MTRQLTIALFLFFLLRSGIHAQQEDRPILIIDPQGPAGKVSQLIFTRDGRELISISNERAIRFWDVSRGQLLRTLRGELGDAAGATTLGGAISPDGRWLATSGIKSVIWIIDLRSREIAAVLRGHFRPVQTLDFSEDGRLLASGSFDDDIRLWDLECLSPNGDRIASPGEAIEITESKRLRGHSEDVNSIQFSPDGLRLVSASSDGTLLIWGRDSKERGFTRRATLKKHTAEVRSVAYSPDGRFIVSGGHDHRLLLWNGENGAFLRTLDPDTEWIPTTISFSGNGDRFLTSSQTRNRGATVIYSIAGGKRETTFSSHDNSVFASAWHPSAPIVATAGGNNNDIYLWDPDDGKVIHHLTGEGRAAWAVAFSKRGLEVSYGKAVNLEEGKGKWDDLEKIFDFSRFVLRDFDDRRDGLRFRRTISSHGTATLRMKNRSLLEVGALGKIDTRSIRCFTYSPDGSNVIVGSTGALKRYQGFPNGWSPDLDFAGHTSEVMAISPSPDGRYLASASHDQTIRLWDLRARYDPLPYLLFPERIFKQGDRVFSPESLLSHCVKRGAKIKGVSITSRRKLETLLDSAETGDEIRFDLLDGGHWVFTVDERVIIPKTAPLASLFVSLDGEWVCWTPSGYYAASPNGSRYIGWHFNRGINHIAGYLTGEQLAFHFDRPDIVRRAILERRPAREIAGELGLKFDLSEALATAPEVEIVSHQDGQLLKTDRQRVDVVATDTGGGVSELQLFHQGKAIFPDGPGVLRSGEWSVPFSVTLEHGENDLRAVAFGANRIRSKPAEIRLHFEGLEPEADLHLFFVGVDDYAEDSLDLEFARSDAEELSGAIELGAAHLYQNVHVHLLTDQSATKRNLLARFGAIAESARPEDVFIFGFNGHGYLDPGDNPNASKFYLLLHEVTGLSGEVLRDCALSDGEFRRAMTRIPARKQVAFLGACQSGAVARRFAVSKTGDMRILNPAYHAALKQLARSSGVHIFPSAQADQFAFESTYLKRGVFAHSILTAFAGRPDDPDGDGLADFDVTGEPGGRFTFPINEIPSGNITVYKLGAFLQRFTPIVTEKLSGSSQNSVPFTSGSDFPIVQGAR